MREQRHETRARKAKLAVSYITFGTLMIVWSAIWLFYLTVPANISGTVYIATGIILSGIAVVLIGLSLGDIGKEANRDEVEAQIVDADVNVPQTQPSKSTVKTDPSVTVPPRAPEDVELETRRTRNW